MKKIIVMLLVFAMLSLSGCALLEKVGIGAPDGVSAICEIAKGSKPTKITTEVNYLTNDGDSLYGHYVTSTDGKDAIFEYYYEKLATPAESIESGSSERIIAVEGVINYKDGVYYSGDEERWRPGTGTAFDLEFNVDEDFFKETKLNEDETSFTAKVSPENLKLFIGTDLNANADAIVVVTTNGVNLTIISVTCTTANGTVTVRTSYTYNHQELFPELEEDETDTDSTDPDGEENDETAE